MEKARPLYQVECQDLYLDYFLTCYWVLQVPLVLSNEGFTTPKNPIKLKLEPRTTAADAASS